MLETNPAPETGAPSAPDAELVSFLTDDADIEAPAASPKAPAPAAQPEADPAAQPRDAGRFTTADAPAAAPAETPEGEAPAEPAPTEPAPSKPFSYRAYGAEHSPFHGAVEVSDGGVYVPPAAVPQLRQVLSEGHNAESRRRQTDHTYQAKLTSARGAQAALVQRADLTLRKLAELRQDPEALQNWFVDLDRNWAVLEAQVERDQLRQQLEAERQQLSETSLEQEAARLEPQLRGALEQTVEQMIRNEAELGHLDPRQMSERLWNAFFDRVFQEAEQDNPQAGYRAGEVLIDYDAIRAELAYEAKVRGNGSPATSAAAPPKLPVAAPPKPPVTPPPVVSSKGAGAQAKPKVPAFKSTKEADEWFDGGGFHNL